MERKYAFIFIWVAKMLEKMRYACAWKRWEAEDDLKLREILKKMEAESAETEKKHR